MEKTEALQILRSDSSIRRALDLLMDLCAEEAITRLCNVSVKNPEELLECRTRLEGIRQCAAFVKQAIAKPVVS